jgi:hypothetical protein
MIKRDNRYEITKGTWHVIPVLDLRNHESSKDCWCKPQQDDENESLWIHNAMDEREYFERGERKPS